MNRRVAIALVIASCFVPMRVGAIGEGTQIELTGLALEGLEDPRPLARARLAWALRVRTSVDVRLEPRRVGPTDPALFESPFVMLSGTHGFPMPSDSAIASLRRYLELGGFLLIDDASDGDAAFDASVRALLRRTLPDRPIRPIASDHTIFHSFYMVPRPIGRIEGPATMEGIEIDGRMVVVYERSDLGGALSRDALGAYTYPVVPGGESQREQAFRFGVNLVMYALCLDYKDDQVHVPFIMRRRPGARP